ncbi:MAG: alpha/beta hydrolase [Bryobacteraceae bacterium]
MRLKPESPAARSPNWKIASAASRKRCPRTTTQKKGAPPTIIFHGKNDTTVPYRTAEAFAEKTRSVGSRSDLESYDGQTHGFFNYGRGGDEYYQKTLNSADAFLTSLGYLKRA